MTTFHSERSLGSWKKYLFNETRETVRPEHDSLSCAVAPVTEDTHAHPVIRCGAPEKIALFSNPRDFQLSQVTHPNQLFMWSEAALAADMAELSFLAAITAAPRCNCGSEWDLLKLNLNSFNRHLLNSGDKDILYPGLIKSSRCT